MQHDLGMSELIATLCSGSMQLAGANKPAFAVASCVNQEDT